MLLTPFDKIQSHMISGNMRKMEGTTQLVEEGGRTRIYFHTDSIPGYWIPLSLERCSSSMKLVNNSMKYGMKY
jgi:hypothetical protein